MAFGSWFKNIINGAKNIIGKVLPVFKKGAELVSRIAPITSELIGGTAGDVIQKVGNVAGKINQRLNTSKLGGNSGKRKMLLNTDQYQFLNDA